MPINVRSSVHGHGTYAAAFIPAGTLIWSHDPDSAELDPTVLTFTDEQAAVVAANGLPVHRWATRSRNGTWALAVDGSQFMNHRTQTDPDRNTVICEGCGSVIAVRDIPVGEEIRCDYEVDDTGVGEKIPGLTVRYLTGQCDTQCVAAHTNAHANARN